jgi:hypothetical protein
MLTSGLTVYRGHNNHPLEAEPFDIRAYLPAASVTHGGNVDWGDIQEVHSGDYIRALHGRPSTA